jgi:integration host factor subunit beta
MNKKDLIESLKQHYDLSFPQAQAVVETFFGSVIDNLAGGDRVEIRGLCSFFVKEYKSYAGRNPKTGEMVQVKPKKLPFFKCGTDLKNRVNR